jgi:hypothetical protein
MSAEGESNQPGQPAPPTNAWAWPVAWMVTVLLLAGAGIYVFRSCRSMPGEVLDKTRQVIDHAGDRLAEVAAAFNQGTITTTFTSYATSVSGSQFLQFATLSQEERFRRTDESSTAFGYIPLPDVIVEANAPVTYTYYLDLNDRWEFTLKDGLITVVAPNIKFNKPAVDASRITYEVKKDSMIRDTRAAMEELKRSISWMVDQKARENIGLVREAGRKQTEAFVRNWLAHGFADGKKYPVAVRFRNEGQAHAPGPVLKEPK